jgi:integrase
MARTIHKLTETAIKNARPIEDIVPLSGEALAVVLNKIEQFTGQPPIVREGNLIGGGLTPSQWKAVEAELKHPIVVRNGRPVMIRWRSRLLADGGNLFLQVSGGDDGVVRRSWIFKYASAEQVISAGGRARRREISMGLGPLHTVDLAMARSMALELRKQRLTGIDPLHARREAKTAEAVAKAKAMTFDDARDAFIADYKFNWRSAKHARNFQQTLQDYVSPAFGHLPVIAIDQEMVIKMLRPLFQEKPVTASRIRGRVEQILDWATQNRHRPFDAPNPARWKGALALVFGARRHEIKHLPALPFAEMPAFMARLREMTRPDALALELLILTAVRTGALLAATWSWLPRNFDDDDQATWNIPKEYTKHRRGLHRVPLVLAMIDVLKKLDRGEPSERLFDIHGKAMRLLAKRVRDDIGVEGDVTPHGMRSCFRDWAGETTTFEPMVVEQALGHWQGDETELAYRRGDLLLKRRFLMQAWSSFCDGKTESGENVVPMSGRRG